MCRDLVFRARCPEDELRSEKTLMHDKDKSWTNLMLYGIHIVGEEEFRWRPAPQSEFDRQASFSPTIWREALAEFLPKHSFRFLALSSHIEIIRLLPNSHTAKHIAFPNR